MVNKCFVGGCKTNYPDLFGRWKRFCNRLNCEPTDQSRICRGHFEALYMKKGKMIIGGE